MMQPSLSMLLAQTLTSATTASSRPFLTLFAVQLSVGVAARLGWIEIGGAGGVLVSFLAIGTGAVLAGVEVILQHLQDGPEILEELWVQRLAAGASTVTATLIFASLGVPEDVAWEVVREELAGQGTVADRDLQEAMVLATQSPYPLHIQGAALGVAVTVNIGLGMLRARVLEILRDLDVERTYQWVETGGVLVVLVLLPLVPLLALALVALASLVLALAGGSTMLGQYLLDQRRRRACPECGLSVRVEASRCHGCQAQIPVVQLLAPVAVPPEDDARVQ